ncbi:hypothetical protein NDU88_002776 [Pleurodeles waltl]|uniref:Uncharacterized protein n=1 Tax=Pleurodeles waltl TaxID=8319 RepID=A0AAV7Q9V3_PLEWA|nr:hypothetical protein NDU88_002776 [Pleurodeles waltl]
MRCRDAAREQGEDVLYPVWSLVKRRSQLRHETPKGMCGACAQWRLTAVGAVLAIGQSLGDTLCTDFCQIKKKTYLPCVRPCSMEDTTICLREILMESAGESRQ